MVDDSGHRGDQNPHRVVLWPQAFYTPKQARVICYDKRAGALSQRFVRMLTGLTSCERERPEIEEERPMARNPEEVRDDPIGEGTCNRIRRLYEADASAWEHHCGGEQQQLPAKWA